MPKLDPHGVYYMGVDPGQSGGIAVIRSTGSVVQLMPMPATERDVFDSIKYLAEDSVNAVIEKVHSMPKQGVASAFTFGKGYGGLRMALIAASIPFDEVTPARWQKFLGVVPRNAKTESKNDHKKKLLQKAQQLFPNVKITLKTADALLIAEFCRRTCMGIK